MNDQKIDYSKLYFPENLHALSSDGVEYDFTITIRFLADGEPDCKIGDFANNLWIRTNKGVKGEKYKTKNTLKHAVEETLRNRGFHSLKWV